MEDSRQSSQHGMAWLLHRRKVTADAAKSGDPSRTTKGAINLLLHFGPAKVPLRLIIRKRNPQIVEQSQHLLCSQEQGIQQILGLALLGLAFPFSRSRHRWRWLSSIPSRQNLEIARDPVVALDRRHSGQMKETPLLARVMQIEQEVLHLGGPLLLLLLGDGGTIASEMGSTDTVSTVIGIIADQPIVTSSTKAWPDPDFVHSLPTSRPMPRQMR